MDSPFQYHPYKMVADVDLSNSLISFKIEEECWKFYYSLFGYDQKTEQEEKELKATAKLLRSKIDNFFEKVVKDGDRPEAYGLYHILDKYDIGSYIEDVISDDDETSGEEKPKGEEEIACS